MEQPESTRAIILKTEASFKEKHAGSEIMRFLRVGFVPRGEYGRRHDAAPKTIALK
jgi:hypothetical protein